MIGATINQFILFDPYDPSNSDFATDFNPDPTGSPVLPISIVLSSSPFALANDWITWDKIDQASPTNSFFKTEPIDGSVLAFIPPRTSSLSPAINTIDLTMPNNVFPENMSKSLPIIQQPTTLTQPPVLYSSPRLTPQVEAQFAPSTTRRKSSKSLKRKSSSSPYDEDATSPPPPARRNSATKKDEALGPKKNAHGIIEKRYRTNLNDKIAQLRDSVPALRIVAQRLDQQEGENGEFHDGEDPAPVPKLNKATILSKATEYITQLEKKNRELESENDMLRGRMEGLRC